MGGKRQILHVEEFQIIYVDTPSPPPPQGGV